MWRPPPDFGLPKLPKPDVDEIGLDLLARLPQDLGPLGPLGAGMGSVSRGDHRNGSFRWFYNILYKLNRDNHWIMILKKHDVGLNGRITKTRGGIVHCHV